MDKPPKYTMKLTSDEILTILNVFGDLKRDVANDLASFVGEKTDMAEALRLVALNTRVQKVLDSLNNQFEKIAQSKEIQ